MRKTREFWRCQNMWSFSSLPIFGEIQPQRGINVPRGAQSLLCKPTASLERTLRMQSCMSKMTSVPSSAFPGCFPQHLLGSRTPLPRCRRSCSSCLWLCSPATSAARPTAAWEHPQTSHHGHPKPFHPQLPKSLGPHQAPLSAKPVPHTSSWCKMCSWYPPEHHF